MITVNDVKEFFVSAGLAFVLILVVITFLALGSRVLELVARFRRR